MLLSKVLFFKALDKSIGVPFSLKVLFLLSVLLYNFDISILEVFSS